MARSEKDKQLNITIDEEKRNAFQKFCAEKGISVTTGVKNAMELAMLRESQELFPDQKANIDDFNLYIGQIIAAYRTVLDRIATADARAEDKVQSQLRSMETIANMNVKLQNELETGSETISELKDQVDKLTTEVSELRRFKAEYDSNEESFAESKRKCAELTQRIADMQLEHAKEIKNLQDENYSKILEVLKTIKQ